MEISGYWLTRWLFQRSLALVYLTAFLAVLYQFTPLLGERGLLPVPQFVAQGSFWEAPSLFYWFPQDPAFTACGWLGLVLALVALSGFSERYGTGVSMGVWAALWGFYLSFVNVGQVFYAFGWESILLEAGFFAIFLGSTTTPPSFLTFLLLRWVLFRVMFGAGLIKLRGDPCWRDYTCLFYHYETQPLPNPLSWCFHWLPKGLLSFGVLVNHGVELLVPFAYFAPQPLCALAGILTLIFQGLLSVSGNFAWLGFLTMVLAFSTLSDTQLAFFLPLTAPPLRPPAPVHRHAILAVTALVVLLSYYPVHNMLSRRQVMNAPYNPFHLVSTYGAFGSISRRRYEVIIEGTAETHLTPATPWREYEFMGKPGDVQRRPPQIAPYHLRLDWLLWFLPFHLEETPRGIILPDGYEPWFVHFLAKLLQGDRAVLQLLEHNPFPDQPPSYVRALLYTYRFTTPQEKRETGAWWHRELVGTYFAPVSLQDPTLRAALSRRGWLEEPSQQ